MTARVVTRLARMSRLHIARSVKADRLTREWAAQRGDVRIMAQIKALSDRVWTEYDTGPITDAEREFVDDDGA